MGQVIQAEQFFLKRREEHIASMKREGELRDAAALAARYYRQGFMEKSNEIILNTPLEDRAQFREYIVEYLRYYESE